MYIWFVLLLSSFLQSGSKDDQDSRSITTASTPGPLLLQNKGNIRKSLPLHRKHQVSPFFFLSLLIAGDVNVNPGPHHRQASIFPCGLCDRNVSATDCVACDGCDVWYHRSCMEIGTADWSLLQHKSVQWICHKCDSINCNSFTFHSYCIDSQNYYQPLSDISVDPLESPTHFRPLQTSSPRNTSNPLIENSTNSKIENSKHAYPLLGQPNKQNSTSSNNSSKAPKKKNLRVLTVNCQSVRSKRADFIALINYHKPDIVCGTESWFTSDHYSAEVFPEEFSVYRKDRGSLGGGVFILVHKSLASSHSPELDAKCEMSWVKVHLHKAKELLVGCFYMPQRSSKPLEELRKSLEKIVNKEKQKQIILSGDFNCPHIDWETPTVPPGSDDRQIQFDLVNIASETQLTQVHNEPTRGKNILDLVFTSNPSLCKNSETVAGIADHHALVTDFDITPQRIKQKKRKHYIYSKVTEENWNDINNELFEISKNIQSKEITDVESMWTFFKDSLMSVVNKYIPSGTGGKSNDLPWMNRKCKRQVRRKQRLYNQAQKTGNWSNYFFCQKETRRNLRKAENDFIQNKIEKGLKENSTKPFWQYVKSRRQDNTGVAPLLKGSELKCDAPAKAKILLDQFCSVFTKVTQDSMPSMNGPKYPEIENLEIDVNGVVKLLKNLNPSKAPGPDGIPSKVLKTCAEAIAPSLTCIFNLSLRTGQLPSDWRSANITAIYKQKGNRNKAENYRPVSLTSIACKFLEHIVCRHMQNHLLKYKILTDKNHGFRSGHSCETQLLTTTNDLMKAFEDGHQTDVVVLDFSKAFDTVPHNKLLHKLDHYGIRGPLHIWIGSFLKERKMRVVVDGEHSEEAPVLSGVPQGTVLGPLLFLCHINDLPDSVSSTVRLFADDCLMYRNISNFNDHIKLQEDLNSLETWADRWGMRFNAEKCYTLQTRTKSSFMYSLCGTFLKPVKETTYLGINISSNLKWNAHIQNITRKAGQTLGFIRRNLQNCPKECRRLAYIALVRSKLEYASSVWDPHTKENIDRIEKVQRQAARFIQKDYRSREPGCVTRMLEELKLPPLETRRRNQRLQLLKKIKNDNVPSMPPGHFLTPANKSRRQIKPRTFGDFIDENILERLIIRNSDGFSIPPVKTEQYKHSFFIRTPQEWNHLTDSEITVALAPSAASSAQVQGTASPV